MSQALQPPRRRSFAELYAEVQALPEGTTGEILRPDRIETMGRPGKLHRRASKLLDDFLRAFDRARGGTGWWVESEVEIQFPPELPLFPEGRLAVPDLAAWWVERVAELPDENPLRVLPDFCCEVLSPSTRRVDRTLKLPMYALHGVGHVWLVDPEARTVEVFVPSAGRPMLVASAADDDRVALPPFDAPLDLASLWAT